MTDHNPTPFHVDISPFANDVDVLEKMARAALGEPKETPKEKPAATKEER